MSQHSDDCITIELPLCRMLPDATRSAFGCSRSSSLQRDDRTGKVLGVLSDTVLIDGELAGGLCEAYKVGRDGWVLTVRLDATGRRVWLLRDGNVQAFSREALPQILQLMEERKSRKLSPEDIQDLHEKYGIQ